jgi:chromosome segregation ATPase
MSRPSTAAPSVNDGFADLESTLLAQEVCYQRLRELVGRRREAIRTADLELLKETLDEERSLVTRVSELDRRRTATAAELAKRLGAPQQAGSIRALIARAPQAARERLQQLADRLRFEVEAVKEESARVRAAADALAQHVAGVLQSVSSAFATTKTYGRAGRVANGSAIRSIDIRS